MSSSSTVSSFLALLVVAASVRFASPAGAAEGSDGLPKIRALVITGGHGYEKPPFEAIFKGHPDIEPRFVEYPAAAGWFAPEKWDDYDVLVFYDMWQKLSEKQKENLNRLLGRGVGVVALHHCLASFQTWPAWRDIVGGRFYIEARTEGSEKHSASSAHHGQDMHIKIADRNHPITKSLADFDIHDETYNNFRVNPKVHVLLTTDHPKSTKTIGWCHVYRNSPVAYVQLGHDQQAYDNPSYRKLVTQSIRWAGHRLGPVEPGFVSLFNGKNLDGWVVVGENKAGFKVNDGVIISQPHSGAHWMRTKKQYSDFILKLDWRVGKEGNAGVFARSAAEGDPWTTGHEIQISNAHRDDMHCTGSLYGNVAVSPRPDETADRWHSFEIHCIGKAIKVVADGVKIIDVKNQDDVEGLKAKPLAGYIGVQDAHNPKGSIEYRNIRVKDLSKK